MRYLIILCLFLLSVSLFAEPITTVKVTQSRPGACVTFGQVFRRGDVRETITLSEGRRPVGCQMDVVRRHPDGSIRFAVITVDSTKLSPGLEHAMVISAASAPASTKPISLEALLKSGFSAHLIFTFPDGTKRTADAAKMLRDGPRTSWLTGPFACEWVVNAPPLAANGAADPDLMVQFSVRAVKGGRAARIAAVVENCADTWGGNIRYDVRLEVGGKTVYERTTVDHRRSSRWRYIAWNNSNEGDSVVFPELKYLELAGVIPAYDATLKVPNVSVEASLRDFDAAPKDILQQGALVAGMGTTGGRAEIAPYPEWAVKYLLTGNAGLWKMLITQGDLAGSWPIHVRVRKTGRLLSVESRPDFWLDDRGKDRPQWKPDRTAPAADRTKLEPDCAHQPSLAYLPALLTGDYYYVEETAFWAAYSIMAQWPEVRKGAKGIIDDQVRGDAWALRNIADAEWICPAAWPETAYLSRIIDNNLKEYARVMVGPPVHSPNGSWKEWDVQEARIPNPANPRWLVTSPWERDYLIWSLHHLTELGHAKAAAPRDYLLKMRVGMFTHPDVFDPILGAPYRMIVGERNAEGSTRFYDWKELGAENRRIPGVGIENYANSYAYSARVALICGIDGGFPGAKEALKELESRLPSMRDILANAPFWAITTRNMK